ncbi:MAG TPA: thioredoxin domain-containing protein [Pyrinomonadaceae bacterium]|nr:thioredoxin domain-containing protein [Pyrinomonadaceae bacterium]
MTVLAKFALIIFVILASQTAIAQRVDDVLATSTAATFKTTSLSANGQRILAERRKLVNDARASLLAAMISEAVVDLESKAQNSTREKLLEAARMKVTEPTPAQIKTVYDANRDALGGRSIEDARPQIVEFIKHEAGDKAVENLVQTLRTKYKVTLGKDINSVGLAPTEMLATIGTRTITVREYDQTQKFRLNDIEMEIYEELKSDLESAIFSTLVAEEAKARSLDVSALLATEITDKLREFSEEERAIVESDLMRRLFAKYNVKFQLAEPTPIVQVISVDDDPQIGNAAAPVTIVMFTDFQCPACARAHPALKNVMAAYGDRVRLVVRDFPLEAIHENSFQAALAANAARVQGKFNEYTDLLYRRQDALDRASLVKYATELGLNAKQFELDFNDAKTAAEVRKDQTDGRGYGIAGTPAIFVNGVKVHRLSLHGFRTAIDRALKK